MACELPVSSQFTSYTFNTPHLSRSCGYMLCWQCLVDWNLILTISTEGSIGSQVTRVTMPCEKRKWLRIAIIMAVILSQGPILVVWARSIVSASI